MVEFAQLFRDRYGTALISDAAFRIGAEPSAASRGLVTIDEWARPVGPVVTVEANNDLVSILDAVHRAAAGDVVVISNVDDEVGVMGDLIGAEAVRKELGGFVVAGSVRDRSELIALGVPVACRGTYPVGPLKIPAGERGIGRVNVPVDVGGAVVRPGMWAFADADGAIFLEAKDVEAVFARAAESVRRENDLSALIRGGTSLAEALQLETFLEKRSEDPSASFGDHLVAIGRAI